MNENASNSPKRVLIAGCGYVGTALGEALAGAGHTVFGLRRDPGSLPRAIQPVKADLDKPASLGGLPAGLDWVVYAAGAAGFTEEAYRAAYPEGSWNLVNALAEQSQKPQRVLFTSSTGVYAQTDGESVDEESPTQPTTFSGTALLEAEAVFRAAPWPSIALRLGGIYGPGRTRLIDRVRSGEANREPEPSRWLNLIHRDDIVGAIVHLLELGEPAPVYLGVDSEPQRWNELIEWFANELGVDVPPIDPAPSTKRPPRSRRCSNKRLVASGYEFNFPSSRAGYRELL